MSIFKGQGKSGVTGPTVQKTVGKNKVNHAKNEAMTTRNIVENSTKNISVPMEGKPDMEYSPQAASYPVYNGRPKRHNSSSKSGY